MITQLLVGPHSTTSNILVIWLHITASKITYNCTRTIEWKDVDQSDLWLEWEAYTTMLNIRLLPL